MRESHRICDWCQEIIYLLCRILKSIGAEYKTFYYGKLLLAQHKKGPSYCVLFPYMSFFLLPLINEDSVHPHFSTERKRNTAMIYWVSLDILYRSGISSSNKNPLGWEGVFFSVNNNPRQNTWTSLLEELDGISEFHCSCFSENRVFILAICVGKGLEHTATCRRAQLPVSALYWGSMFPSPQHKFPAPFSVV
jgi:hypothetical protein